MSTTLAYKMAIKLLAKNRAVPIDIIAQLEADGFIWDDIERHYQTNAHLPSIQ